jgi:hypothetical protein
MIVPVWFVPDRERYRLRRAGLDVAGQLPELSISCSRVTHPTTTPRASAAAMRRSALVLASLIEASGKLMTTSPVTAVPWDEVHDGTAVRRAARLGLAVRVEVLLLSAVPLAEGD